MKNIKNDNVRIIVIIIDYNMIVMIVTNYL